MKASSESGECASLISITRVVACLMAIALPEKLQLPVTFPYCVPRPDFLRLNGPAESPCATRVPWSRARRGTPATRSSAFGGLPNPRDRPFPKAKSNTLSRFSQMRGAERRKSHVGRSLARPSSKLLPTRTLLDREAARTLRERRSGGPRWCRTLFCHRGRQRAAGFSVECTRGASRVCCRLRSESFHHREVIDIPRAL